jgi:serine/threonine-protein kinase RsbW
MQRQSRSDGHSAPLYERALPAVPPAVGRMRHELDAALEQLGVPSVRRHDVALVLTEAAANVVVHAYAGAAPGLLYTVVALSGTQLVLEVFDGGRGMRSHGQSEGLGVGLALIAQLTDGLEIAPNDEGGVKLTAVFGGMPGVPPDADDAPTEAERLRDYAATLAEAAPDTPSPEAEAEAALAQAQRLRAAAQA